MPGTFTQLYTHIIFSVKGREKLINPLWKRELNKYIAGIIGAKGHKSIIVDGTENHIHCLVGVKPTIAVSDLVRDIKNNSSKFINNGSFLKIRFQWQEGYAAFSYSRSQIDAVYKYIENQEEHHRKKTFKEEYEDLIKKFNIEYDKKYLFD